MTIDLRHIGSQCFSDETTQNQSQPLMEESLVNVSLVDVSGIDSDYVWSDLLQQVLADDVCAAFVEATEIRCRHSGDRVTQQDDDASFKRKTSLNNKLRESILKYVKWQDQCMALVSILLKSRSFHQVYPDIVDDCCVCNNKERPRLLRPLVNLPRTPHRKPYIPVWSVSTFDNDSVEVGGEGEENVIPISVSHQYPYVGIVRFGSVKAAAWRLGIDIVVFDEINKRLYENVYEFVEVFQESFSRWEWTTLQASVDAHDDETILLREFYLRWAVKEAYTKALGVGLGFPFGSFETRFHHNTTASTNLWRWLEENDGQSSYVLLGNVVKLTPLESAGTFCQQSENWLFYFEPLPASEASTNQRARAGLPGVACVCVGPVESPFLDSKVPDLQVEWTDIAKLVAWHGPT